jgi:putative SOS response-associated peptidase YedK
MSGCFRSNIGTPYWSGSRPPLARRIKLGRFEAILHVHKRCQIGIEARQVNQQGKPAWSQFTIITTEPNELIEPIHNRIPVILRPEDEEQWLDVHRRSFAKAQSLLKPLPEELMDAHDVSPIVNSAKYDGPECIQPV